jgi:hypothetical protein
MTVSVPVPEIGRVLVLVALMVLVSMGGMPAVVVPVVVAPRPTTFPRHLPRLLHRRLRWLRTLT